MATRSMPFWPRPATTSGSSWPGSGLCAPFSGRLSWSGMTRAAPPPHPPERPNSLFHRRLAGHRFTTRAIGMAELAPELAGLRAPLGVYAILGNHDWWDDPAAQRAGRGPIGGAPALR